MNTEFAELLYKYTQECIELFKGKDITLLIKEQVFKSKHDEVIKVPETKIYTKVHSITVSNKDDDAVILSLGTEPFALRGRKYKANQSGYKTISMIFVWLGQSMVTSLEEYLDAPPTVRWSDGKITLKLEMTINQEGGLYSIQDVEVIEE